MDENGINELFLTRFSHLFMVMSKIFCIFAATPYRVGIE